MRSCSEALAVHCLVVSTSWVPSSARGVAQTGQVRPDLFGPTTFGSDGTLFAADNQAAAVFGLYLAA